VGVERLQATDYLKVTGNNTNLIQYDPSKSTHSRAKVYMECTRIQRCGVFFPAYRNFAQILQTARYEHGVPVFDAKRATTDASGPGF
jgi:hypothetical protein